MLIANVVGRVVSTRKNESLVGYTLLVLEVQDPGGAARGERLVAADTLGAGVGEAVLVARGGAARLALPAQAPVDAAVVGIIDTVDVG